MPERCLTVGDRRRACRDLLGGARRGGMVPFCNIYSTFMQRAYDNVIHDVAIQGLPVVMCLDRGGLVGEDGVTHHGVFDMAAFGGRAGADCRRADERTRTPQHDVDRLAGRRTLYDPLSPRARGGTAVAGPAVRDAARGPRTPPAQGRDVALVTVGTVGNAAARAAEHAAAQGGGGRPL